MKKNYFLLAAITLVVLLSGLTLAACTKTGANGAVVIKQKGSLKIPVKNVTGTVTFFPAEVNDIYIEVMAVKAPDNSIHTAFNTCESCYTSGKGYYIQEGNEVVCQNCGMHFSIDSISAKAAGGCQPIPIFNDDRTISGDFIQIPYKVLLGKTPYFLNWKTAN